MPSTSAIFSGSSILEAIESKAKMDAYLDSIAKKQSQDSERVFIPIDLNKTDPAISFTGYLLSIARSTAWAAQGFFKFVIHNEVVKSLEGTKFLSVASMPSTLYEIAQDVKVVIWSKVAPSPKTDEEKADRLEEVADAMLNITANVGSLVEGVGMTIEATIAVAGLTGRVVLAADILGYASTAIGLVSFVIDSKAIYQATVGYKELNSDRFKEIDPLVKKAFNERLSIMIGTRSLNLLATTIYLASFVCLLTTTATPAGWALVAAAGAILITVKVVEWYADYRLHNNLQALNLYQALDTPRSRKFMDEKLLATAAS